MSAETSTETIGGGAVLRLGEGDSPPEQWTRLMAAAGEVAFVHEPFWTAAVCSHDGGLQGRWLMVEESGRPVGGLPLLQGRRGPLTRWVGHHDGVPTVPLLAEDLPPERRAAVLAALADGCRRLSSASNVLDFALYLEEAWDDQLGAELHTRGFRREPVPTAGLPLFGGIDQVERHVLKRNRRNERNRSLKMGCEAAVSVSDDDLDAFQIIHAAACERWKMPPVPSALIRNLVRDSGGKVFLSLVRHQDRMIGGHLCWHDRDEINAWLGATVPEDNDKFPSTLLVWNDLQEACRRGASWLDLGGDGGVKGVANFKKLLGAVERRRGCWRRAPWTGRLIRSAYGLARRPGGA